MSEYIKIYKDGELYAIHMSPYVAMHTLTRIIDMRLESNITTERCRLLTEEENEFFRNQHKEKLQ